MDLLLEQFQKNGDVLYKKRFGVMSNIYMLVISAIWNSEYDFIELLLKYVIDINERYNNECYLSMAIQVGNPDIIELLKMHGARE